MKNIRVSGIIILLLSALLLAACSAESDGQKESMMSLYGVNHRIKGGYDEEHVVKCSNGTFEACYFGSSPIQTEWPSEPGSYYPQSEDCLRLNIWTNEGNDSETKPVMVFFHGGSYTWGAASDPMYDGYDLVSKYDDLILVTVEFRRVIAESGSIALTFSREECQNLTEMLL